jgi:hypothetical protein
MAGGTRLPLREPSSQLNVDPASGGSPEAAVREDTPVVLPHQPLLVVQIEFDIFQARVPKGMFSESGRIWNHLDEEAIPASTAVLLQRNGLRVGRGRLSSWPPIKALLESEPGIETSQHGIILNNGLPLTVELDRTLRDQTLFMFRPDGTLGGVTYPDSYNLLRVEYGLSPTEADALLMEVMPEIRQRQTLQPLTISATGELDRPVVEPTRVLRELAFRMQLSQHDFCVVGPSPTAHQPHLAGTLLLCEQRDGRAHESMYFITPRVHRADRPLPADRSGRDRAGGEAR